MANLSIRNLDEGVVERLRRRARSHNRSLEAEIRDILTDATHISREEFWAYAAKRREELRGKWDGDLTAMIREDRDR
jgi:plasmid stability protein